MSQTWADLRDAWYAVGTTWAGIFQDPPVWKPNLTVRIGSQDYTSSTVGRVTIRRGRDTVYSSAQPGYASFDLIDVDGSFTPPQAGQRVSFDVDSSTGGERILLFSGQIANWSTNVTATGGDPVVVYRVQAVGPLARLNRRTILFGGRSQELDGARVGEAIAAGLATAWEEVGPDVIWDSVPDDVTWANFDGGFRPELVDPGVFQIAALDASSSGYTALQVASEAAESAEGVIFETADGFIGYADSDRRQANADAGFAVVPFGAVAAGGVSVSQDISDVTNRVTVEFDSGAVTETDTDSVEAFGEVFATRLTTNLANQSAAEARASVFLFRHAQQSEQLGRLDFILPGVIPPLRDRLLRFNENDALKITGIPSKVGFTDFDGFVEGIEVSITEFDYRLGLLVSDARLSLAPFRPIEATGGDTVNDVEIDGRMFRVHQFTTVGSSQSFEVQDQGSQRSVEYLVVGGGGGGGGRDIAGGGGAGGVLAGSTQVLLGTFPVVVGAGGAGGIDTGSAGGNAGANGSDSFVFGVTAVGGGGGGGWVSEPGDGGSGGGGGGITTLTGGSGTAGQGFAGGNGANISSFAYGGAGGGGAGEPGQTALQGRKGGDGIESSITGTATFYAGGGGGAGHRVTGNTTLGDGGAGGGGAAGVSAGVSGTNGLGGGGGASRAIGGTGGAGGSGIVIVRYPLEP